MEKSNKEKLKKLIASGEVEKAVEMLLRVIAQNAPEWHNLSLVSRRFAVLEDELRKGSLTPDSYFDKKSQLLSSLLQVVDDLDVIPTLSARSQQEVNSSFSFQKFESAFHFTKLSLQNTRCFSKKQHLQFLDRNGQPARWNIIIGDNGVGKTTILRALATVLMFHPNGNSWKKLLSPIYFFRLKEFSPQLDFQVCRLGIASSSDDIAEFSIQIQNDEFLPGGKSNFLHSPDSVEKLNIFAYGASRKIGSTGFTNETDFPASSLFDENALLTNAEEWLVKSDYLALKSGSAKSSFNKVANLLKKLMGGEVKDLEIRTEGNSPAVMFLTAYGWVGLHQLSLGYKTLIAWMVDFAKGMFERYPDSDDPFSEPAILLVDEIDLHLHPKLQHSLMKFLTDMFPKTQFIATAHSPLVVQSAENGNVILLKKRGDHVVVVQNPFEVKNWRIDQLLTSDLYGLSSARSPKSEEKIERRRALLKKNRRSEQEQTELARLEEDLVELPVGESPEAIHAMDIIQRAAKRYEQNNGKH